MKCRWVASSILCFLLRLSRHKLSTILFLCVILCLHRVPAPPASYLPLHSSSIPCIDSLYSPSVYERKVNSGMNVRVTVRVTFAASFPLLPSILSSLQPQCPRPSLAPWLCVGNERSRHALSGLRPWKAGRQAEWGQAGRGSFSLDTYTPGMGTGGFWGMLRGHGEGEEFGESGMNRCNRHWSPTFCGGNYVWVLPWYPITRKNSRALL